MADEPAYPQCDLRETISPDDSMGIEHVWRGGLTKREWFAGMAMQGLLANKDRGEWTLLELAKESCYYTDALLTELEREASDET